jgi:nitrate reductase NapAB chaperone NapD
VPICSYLVIAQAGEAGALARRLEEIPGCQAVRASNRDVLLLVTETPGVVEEVALRTAIEGLPGLQAVVLTFGELDAGAEPAS